MIWQAMLVNGQVVCGTQVILLIVHFVEATGPAVRNIVQVSERGGFAVTANVTAFVGFRVCR